MIEQLFLIYIIVGVLYNLLSVLLREMGGRQLSPNEPLTSIPLLASLFLLYSHSDLSGLGVTVRSTFLIAFSVLIVRFGILKHLINYDEGHYFSKNARLSAAWINIVGVVSLLPAIAKF